MGKVIASLIIIGIIAGFVFIATESDTNPGATAIRDIQKITKTFETGDQIDLFLQPDVKVESQEYTYPETQQTIQNSTNSTNSTAPPIITRTTLDARCTPNPANPYDPCGNKAGTSERIQIGNIVTIAGNIRIVDPYLTTDPQNPVLVPPPFKYSLEIFCDFREFCNLDPVAISDRTNTVGNFQYKWTTHQRLSEGEYIARIFARSETMTPEGIPFELVADYRFELYK